ncbi:MAG TPA: plastocyanin/azurin family copper-binding protein [Longimicrobiales bacterium]|nr:plastocyanin/azurin family copper-binding protein [Longimicrobiales bacterium]
MQKAIRNVLAVTLVLLQGACGSGGSDSSTAPPPARGEISGTVRSGQAGVAGASLALSGSGLSRSTITGSAGTYTFADLPAGPYTLNLALPGGFELGAGETATKTTTLAAGQSVVLDFTLAPVAGGVVTIDVVGFTFSPATITVAPGTTVRWVNDSDILHTVTPDGHTAWSDTNLPAGATFEHTFENPGSYPYFCTPHLAAGMTGTISVQ